MKKLPFNIGDVLSIKLRDDLYTLAQISLPSYVTFFDISSADGKWKNVDLNNTAVLFCIIVATTRIKPLVDAKLSSDAVRPSTKPMGRLFINAGLNFAGGGHPFRGGNLIEVDERGETTQRPIIKRSLSVENDADVIRQYELTNMWNDPEELRRRLLRYFDTGINWDPHKEKVFPGITPPVAAVR